MRENILTYIRKQRFIIGALILTTLLFLWMIRAYIIPLILAVIVTGLFAKFYDKLLSWTKERKGLSATIVVLTVLLLLVIPLGGFIGIVIDEAEQIGREWVPKITKELQNNNGDFTFPSWLPGHDYLDQNKDEVLQRLNKASGKVGEAVVNGLASFTGSAFTLFLQLFIFLYALFYFVMDRKHIVQRIKDFIPLSNQEIDDILVQMISVTRATLKGALLIGIIQGSLVGIAFAVIGIPGAAFWGAISIALSIIPSVGSGLVWVPAALILFAQGHHQAAIGLTLWGALVVGSIDNVLRPKLVGRDAKLSDLTIFLSTLGGIGLFGVTGFILGPVLAGLTKTAWDIYEQEIIKPNKAALNADYAGSQVKNEIESEEAKEQAKNVDGE